MILMGNSGTNTLLGATTTVRPERQGGSTGRIHLLNVNPSMVCPAKAGEADPKAGTLRRSFCAALPYRDTVLKYANDVRMVLAYNFQPEISTSRVRRPLEV